MKSQTRLAIIAQLLREKLLSLSGDGLLTGTILRMYSIKTDDLEAVLKLLDGELIKTHGDRCSISYSIGKKSDYALVQPRTAKQFKPMAVCEPDELKRAREGRPEGFYFKAGSQAACYQK
jgi:hypothetical protein